MTSRTERFIEEIVGCPAVDFSDTPGEHVIEFACFWLHATLYSESTTGSRDLLDRLKQVIEALASQVEQRKPDRPDAAAESPNGDAFASGRLSDPPAQ